MTGPTTISNGTGSSNKSWSPSLSISGSEEEYHHSFKRLLLIVVTILIFLVSLTLNVLDSTGANIFGIKLHYRTTHNAFIRNPTELTNALWMVNLWIVIYIWQFAWLVYGVTTIFRKSSSDYLYKYPPVMHWLTYLNFSIANIMHICCIVFWSYNLFIFATVYAFLMCLSLYISAFTSLFKLSDYQREMYYTEKMKDVWCIRVLVQNGTLLYAAWTFIMFMLSLEVVLVHKIGLTRQFAHLLIIGIMAIKLVTYFLIENVTAYKYCKFMIMPWILYGIYLIDMLVSIYFLSPAKKSESEPLVVSTAENIEISILKKRFSFISFAQTCLVSLFLFLFICKLIKFIYSEFCYRKKFLNNF